MAFTTLSPSLQASKQVARIVTVAFVGITYFVVVIIALHFLRPDLNPIQRPTSEYAVRPYDWLTSSAFLA